MNDSACRRRGNANANLVLGFGIFACLVVLTGITIAFLVKQRGQLRGDGMRQVVAVVKSWPGVVDADAMTENPAVWMMMVHCNSTVTKLQMRAYGGRFTDMAKPFAPRNADMLVTVTGWFDLTNPQLITGTRPAASSQVTWVDFHSDKGE